MDQQTEASGAPVDVLAQVDELHAARTEFSHARQRCLLGQCSQQEYEAARDRLTNAKAALARIGGAA
jgi:phosphoribosyl-dephospho-CoA transferase